MLRIRATTFSVTLLIAVSLHAQFTIEINQGIGIQKNNALKFVAGTDAVIRAFLPAPVTIDPTQTSATCLER